MQSPDDQTTTEVQKTVIETESGTQSATQTTITQRERIAVVKAVPRRWYQSVATKLGALVSGNLLFLWVWGQIELVRSFELSTYIYLIGIGVVLVASIIWVVHVITDDHRYNRDQKEIDKLLVEQNSTPDNLAQLIPAEQVDLYRARGFKIITRGDLGVPQSAAAPTAPVLPQGQ